MKTVCAIIGALFFAFYMAGVFGVIDFQMCVKPVGQCAALRGQAK